MNSEQYLWRAHKHDELARVGASEDVRDSHRSIAESYRNLARLDEAMRESTELRAMASSLSAVNTGE